MNEFVWSDTSLNISDRINDEIKMYGYVISLVNVVVCTLASPAKLKMKQGNGSDLHLGGAL